LTFTATIDGDLACSDAAGRVVHRVGYDPEPWAWTPWQFAEGGRFSGRWDDPDGRWRTLYVGESRLVCLLEVLAVFRPDPRVQEDLAGLEVEDQDARDYPTATPGTLDPNWLASRRIGSAVLQGWYALPGDKQSLPTLRSRFSALATHHQLPDVDSSAIRAAEPREFTQAIAGWMYQQEGPDARPLAGVAFNSRHGDGLWLWAVFEQPGDGDVSGQLGTPRPNRSPAATRTCSMLWNCTASSGVTDS